MKYILEGKEIKEVNLTTWARWFETANRHIGKDTINGVDISTVFLGIDHSFDGKTPVLFETMVFGGKYDQEQERYCTYNEAENGHRKWVQKVTTTQKETVEGV